ncbi:MAG: DUF459 domain-containing protein [Actinomycetota bacterium]
MATTTRSRSRWTSSGNGFKPKHRAEPDVSLEGSPDQTRPQRYVGPAGRVLVLMLICFSVWTILAAPALKRAAEVSPIGIRRSAALAVLRPLARVSAFVGLDRLGSAGDRVLGRNEAPAVPPAAPEPKYPVPTAAGPSPSAPLQPILPKPTRVSPLTVLMVGDSIGADLAFGLSRLLSDKGTFRPREHTQESSGLARPDYFNWHDQLAVDISEKDPDVVVVMFGGNDGQNFLIGDHGVVLGSREWKSAYRSRVDRMMDLVIESGRPLIWVGMPIMKDPARSKVMRMLNSIYESEANAHPGVLYVDSYELFSNVNGRYSAYLRDRSGRVQQVRESDGIHLTIGAGGTRLAQAVYRVMRTLWEGATEQLPAPDRLPETVPHGRMTSPPP